MHGEQALVGLGVMAVGIGLAAICVAGFRSDRYLRWTAGQVLAVYRLQTTPDRLRRYTLRVRVALGWGMGMGAVVAALGLLAILQSR